MMTYDQKVKVATVQQGIDVLVEALDEAGVFSTAEQTGGFCMCAYVEINDNHYIYANLYGASIYDGEGYDEDIIQFDEEQEPKVIAQAIADYVKKVEASK